MPTQTHANEPKQGRPYFPGLGPRDAQKRLESCGLTVTAMEQYKPNNPGHVWRAKTDKGVRFIAWDGKAWRISKEAPCTHG